MQQKVFKSKLLVHTLKKLAFEYFRPLIILYSLIQLHIPCNAFLPHRYVHAHTDSGWIGILPLSHFWATHCYQVVLLRPPFPRTLSERMCWRYCRWEWQWPTLLPWLHWKVHVWFEVYLQSAKMQNHSHFVRHDQRLATWHLACAFLFMKKATVEHFANGLRTYSLWWSQTFHSHVYQP